MTAGASKAATTITQPALAPSPQPRPAPTARALPPKPVAQGAHCLINNVTGELTVRSGTAIPNRIGVADGRTDQHGYAARDHGGGGRPLSISGADGYEAHSRRTLRGDGLASQACGSG